MTTVATREDAKSGAEVTVGQFITRLQPEIARALPKGMDADRIARLALTVVRQSDIQARKDGKPQNSLANCKPESFAGALLTASALGLEPGVNGEAYLVPYKGECTLIVGYQGYAKLFWNHPLAAHLDAQAVHENDEWDYWYGINPGLVHKPAKTGPRGKATHFYAVARLSTGASAFVVLSADEAKALRGGKVGASGQIKDPQHWMERKTALRQLFKLLPKSTELVSAVTVDEQRGSVLAERGIAGSIAQGDSVPALPPSVTEENAQQTQAHRVTIDEITGEIDEPDEHGLTAADYARMNDEAASDPQNAGTSAFGGDQS